MNRWGNRVIRLERGGGRIGWRAYAGLPVGQGSDEALEGYIAECEGWPAGYQPSDEELRAIASLAGAVEEDEGEP